MPIRKIYQNGIITSDLLMQKPDIYPPSNCRYHHRDKLHVNCCKSQIISYNIIKWSVDVDDLVCRHFGRSTFWFVDVSVCRRFGLSKFWSVDVLVCRRSGLSTFWFVDVLVCRRFGCRRFGLSTFWLSNHKFFVQNLQFLKQDTRLNSTFEQDKVSGVSLKRLQIFVSLAQ